MKSEARTVQLTPDIISHSIAGWSLLKDKITLRNFLSGMFLTIDTYQAGVAKTLVPQSDKDQTKPIKYSGEIDIGSKTYSFIVIDDNLSVFSIEHLQKNSGENTNQNTSARRDLFFIKKDDIDHKTYLGETLITDPSQTEDSGVILLDALETLSDWRQEITNANGLAYVNIISGLGINIKDVLQGNDIEKRITSSQLFFLYYFIVSGGLERIFRIRQQSSERQYTTEEEHEEKINIAKNYLAKIEERFGENIWQKHHTTVGGEYEYQQLDQDARIGSLINAHETKHNILSLNEELQKIYSGNSLLTAREKKEKITRFDLRTLYAQWVGIITSRNLRILANVGPFNHLLPYHINFDLGSSWLSSGEISIDPTYNPFRLGLELLALIKLGELAIGVAPQITVGDIFPTQAVVTTGTAIAFAAGITKVHSLDLDDLDEMIEGTPLVEDISPKSTRLPSGKEILIDFLRGRRRDQKELGKKLFTSYGQEQEVATEFRIFDEGKSTLQPKQDGKLHLGNSTLAHWYTEHLRAITYLWTLGRVGQALEAGEKTDQDAALASEWERFVHRWENTVLPLAVHAKEATYFKRRNSLPTQHLFETFKEFINIIIGNSTNKPFTTSSFALVQNFMAQVADKLFADDIVARNMFARLWEYNK